MLQLTLQYYAASFIVRIKPIPERKNTNPKTPYIIIGLTGLCVPENNTAV